jgi:hypothetical protein
MDRHSVADHFGVHRDLRPSRRRWRCRYDGAAFRRLSDDEDTARRWEATGSARPATAGVGRYVEVALLIGERDCRAVRGDATGVDDAVSPCRQAFADGDQRIASIHPSSVDCALRCEMIYRCGHKDVVASKRDGGAIRGMQTSGSTSQVTPPSRLAQSPIAAAAITTPGRCGCARTSWTSLSTSMVGCHVMPPSVDRGIPPTWTLARIAPSGVTVIERIPSGGPTR